jgi:hypothetical protein
VKLQTWPTNTPEEIRKEVFRNLEIAGEKGGLFCCPTHMLEPEVPWENIEIHEPKTHTVADRDRAIQPRNRRRNNDLPNARLGEQAELHHYHER